MSDGDKKNYDSNYFWSIIVDSIDVLGVVLLYASRCYSGHFFLNAFCLKGKYSRTFWIL